MSGAGFHVHGPHDHELEHAAQGQHGGHGHDEGEGRMSTSRIAMVTAVLATVGAVFAYMGGATQAAAGLYKNDAAIRKTEAANQWAFYQAKSTKQSLAELGRDLAPEDKKSALQGKIERYESEKAEIKTQAERHEAASRAADEASAAQMHTHHRWAQATTVLQVAIAMAAIALLTRRRWLEVGMWLVGGGGVLLGLLAALHL